MCGDKIWGLCKITTMFSYTLEAAAKRAAAGAPVLPVGVRGAATAATAAAAAAAKAKAKAGAKAVAAAADAAAAAAAAAAGAGAPFRHVIGATSRSAKGTLPPRRQITAADVLTALALANSSGSYAALYLKDKVADLLRRKGFKEGCITALAEHNLDSMPHTIRRKCDHGVELQEFSEGITIYKNRYPDRPLTALVYTILRHFANSIYNGAFVSDLFNNHKQIWGNLLELPEYTRLTEEERRAYEREIQEYTAWRLIYIRSLEYWSEIYYKQIVEQYLTDPERNQHLALLLPHISYNGRTGETREFTIRRNVMGTERVDTFTVTVSRRGIPIYSLSPGLSEAEINGLPIDTRTDMRRLGEICTELVTRHNGQLNPGGATTTGGANSNSNTTIMKHIYYPDTTDIELPEITIEDVNKAFQISRLLYPDEPTSEPVMRGEFNELLSPRAATSEPQLRGGKSKKYKKTRKSSRLRKRRQTKRR
jgi:hypothetical protein